MTAPLLQIRDLHKSFGAKQVLRGLDLDVGLGESLVVIGGSGTGKSVLIKTIIGLLDADSGSIAIDDVEVVGMPRRAREAVVRKFGMLFQGGALFDSLPVWENVAFGLIQAKRMPRRQAMLPSWAPATAVEHSPSAMPLRRAQPACGRVEQEQHSE